MSKVEAKTFRVMYTVAGYRLCAGEFMSSTVDAGKCQATNLLQLRRVKTLKGAEIVEKDGRTAAILRMERYPLAYEWVTVR